MSTKTLRKRIALVAVAALGAGVLSVAPAHAGDEVLAAGDILFQGDATKLNACSVIAATAGGTDYKTAYIPSTSSGIRVIFDAGTSDTSDLRVVLSGPGVLSAVPAGSGTAVSTKEFTDATVADTEYFTVTPTGVGVINIKIYDYSSSVSSLKDELTINVVADCGNSTLSLDKSFVTIVSLTEADENAAGWTSTKLDTADANVVANGGTGYIAVRLKDIYGQNLATTTGLLIVEATGDVVVNAAARTTSDNVLAPAAAGDIKTAYLSTAAADVVIRVDHNNGDASNVSVKITYNGVLVGTKNFTFLGVPAKVTISDVIVGKMTSTSNVGSFVAKIVDSAGNPLGGKNIANDATYNAAAAAITSGVTAGSATDATTGKTPALTAGGNAYYTCSTTGKGGAAKLQVKVATNTAETTFIYSDPFTVVCGGITDTWSVSMDKASYAPGEIATLTVSAKDQYGNPVYSLYTVGSQADIAYSFGGLTAVTAPTNSDKFTSGAGTKTYQFAVGTTEGSFVGSWKMTGSTDTAAKTVQYKIAAASGAVSMADVLKAIVSLIASINKQIAALQKALLKK